MKKYLGRMEREHFESALYKAVYEERIAELLNSSDVETKKARVFGLLDALEEIFSADEIAELTDAATEKARKEVLG